MRRSFVSLSDLASIGERQRAGAVAIGNFDGVHRGHQAVVERALREARALGGPAVVLTFEPHPRTFFRPAQPVFRLTPAPLRAEILRDLGVDAVVTLPFDGALAGLDAEAFVRRVLVEGLGAKHVIAGYDFHFGRDRGGSPAFLEEAGARLGFRADVVPAFRDGSGGAVSSSAIREALGAGDVARANGLLGWRWLVEGTVIHGDARGRTLGYPTANMALPPETALAHGVYAVRARVDGAWFAGAASFGRRIQFGDGPPLLETYLLDFEGDLYGKALRIEFDGHLRPEQRFATVDALVEQMGRDVDEARALVTAAVARPQGPLQSRLDGSA